MDIGSKCGYPCSALSNFAPHPFEIDGVQCASIGKNKQNETILTEQEFCSRLLKLRDNGGKLS